MLLKRTVKHEVLKNSHIQDDLKWHEKITFPQTDSYNALPRPDIPGAVAGMSQTRGPCEQQIVWWWWGCDGGWLTCLSWTYTAKYCFKEVTAVMTTWLGCLLGGVTPKKATWNRAMYFRNHGVVMWGVVMWNDHVEWGGVAILVDLLLEQEPFLASSSTEATGVSWSAAPDYFHLLCVMHWIFSTH